MITSAACARRLLTQNSRWWRPCKKFKMVAKFVYKHTPNAISAPFIETVYHNAAISDSFIKTIETSFCIF
jgi:hypothetical protein